MESATREKLVRLTGQCEDLAEAGKWAECIEIMEEVLSLKKDLYSMDHPQFQTSSQKLCEYLNMWAMVQLQKEKFELSLELLRKAELVARNSPQFKATTYNNLGCYYRRTGKLRTALGYLIQALQIEIKQQKPKSLPDTHLNLCAVLSQLDRHDDALQHALLSIILLQDQFLQLVLPQAPNTISDERLAVLAIAYHNLGVQFQHLKRFEESLSIYRKALLIAQEHLSDNEQLIQSLTRVVRSATSQTSHPLRNSITSKRNRHERDFSEGKQEIYKDLAKQADKLKNLPRIRAQEQVAPLIHPRSSAQPLPYARKERIGSRQELPQPRKNPRYYKSYAMTPSNEGSSLAGESQIESLIRSRIPIVHSKQKRTKVDSTLKLIAKQFKWSAGFLYQSYKYTMHLAKLMFSSQLAILQQPKKKRRCDPDCEDHPFYMSETVKSSKNLDISLTLCPKYSRGHPPEQVYPQFNNDGLYYTCSFVLGIDLKYSEQTQKEDLVDHNRIMKEACERKCQLLFPRPNIKHTLCSVCKTIYNNYYLHIISNEHKEKVKRCPYNTHISQLALQFSHLHPKDTQELPSPFVPYRPKKNQVQQEPHILNGTQQKKKLDENGNMVAKNQKEVMPKKANKKKKNQKDRSDSNSSLSSSQNSSSSSSSSSTASISSVRNGHQKIQSKVRSSSSSSASSSSSSYSSSSIDSGSESHVKFTKMKEKTMARVKNQQTNGKLKKNRSKELKYEKEQRRHLLKLPVTNPQQKENLSSTPQQQHQQHKSFALPQEEVLPIPQPIEQQFCEKKAEEEMMNAILMSFTAQQEEKHVDKELTVVEHPIQIPIPKASEALSQSGVTSNSQRKLPQEEVKQLLRSTLRQKMNSYNAYKQRTQQKLQPKQESIHYPKQNQVIDLQSTKEDGYEYVSSRKRPPFIILDQPSENKYFINGKHSAVKRPIVINLDAQSPTPSENGHNYQSNSEADQKGPIKMLKKQYSKLREQINYLPKDVTGFLDQFFSAN